MSNIYFAKVTFSHQELIFAWLDGPPVREFWDNSQNPRIASAWYVGGVEW